MARFTKGAGSLDEDCLHSCLPGPVDTWSRFALEMLLARQASSTSRGAAAVAGAASSAVMGGTAFGGAASASGSGVPAASTRLGGVRAGGGGGAAGGGRRFFSVSPTTWLGDRNAGAQFESGCRGNGCVRATSSHEPWWPFNNCSRRKYVTFCDGDDCQAPVRDRAPRLIPKAGKAAGKAAGLASDFKANRVGEASLRLCDRQGLNCHNLSLARLRGAAARELL